MLRGINEDIALPALTGRRVIKRGSSDLTMYKGKTVFVTGAGGSIGSEIVSQVLSAEPKHVVLLDASEFNLYEVMQTIEQSDQQEVVTPILGCVTDPIILDSIYERFVPEIVIHAAALKHVPLLESDYNKKAAIRTNVIGTYEVMSRAAIHGAEVAVMISTDKAVNPTSVMGATKRLAELRIQNLMPSKTRFITVRFGNVFGSSGSVVPLFRRQIAHGGPVTVTHTDIVRYFMSISDAVHLTLQAASMYSGTYILDMGKPVRIYDLACQLIEQSGLRLGQDIDIEITGLRQGEKLFEELNYADETPVKTSNKGIVKLDGGARLNTRPIKLTVEKLVSEVDALVNIT